MSDDKPGVYEIPPPPDKPLLYDTIIDEEDDSGLRLESLDDLTKENDGDDNNGNDEPEIEIDLDQPPPPHAPQAVQDAYYDALAKKAKQNRDRDLAADQLAQVHKPVEKPTDEDRKKLLERAMSSRNSTSYPVKEGPSQTDRQKLMEQAMKQATITSSSNKPSHRPSTRGPTEQQKLDLLKQATARSSQPNMAEEKESAYSVVKKGKVAPTKQQREEMAKAALKSSPSTRSARNSHGPTDEQRRKLMQQAMAGSKTPRSSHVGGGGGGGGGGGPTAEQRASLANLAMQQSRTSTSRPGAPSAEDRKRLLAAAMSRR